MPQIHATAVSIKGNGVLIRGDPGCGKSDLGLRMIDRGASLVADDRCDLNIIEGELIVSCPETIRGLMEVRGIGVLQFGSETTTVVRLIAELCEPDTIERMPDEHLDDQYGITLPVFRIAPYEASAPAKIIVALGKVLGEIESAS